MSVGGAEPVPASMLLDLPADSRLLAAQFDDQDRLCQANAAFLQAFGLVAGARPSWLEILRMGHRHGTGLLVEADDIEAWILAASQRRRQQRWQAYQADLCDGRWLWVTESIQPDGGLLFIATDITGVQATGRTRRAVQAGELAQIDAQSGVAHREHVMQQLQLALVRPESWPLCVVQLEVDEFQRLHDHHGAEAGAMVLRDLGRQVQASVRREDGCGRLQDGAFLLVLPTAGRGQAGAIAERLLARIRMARPARDLAYRCSAGLAEAVWGETAELLLLRAQSACSEATAAGGDRLSCQD